MPPPGRNGARDRRGLLAPNDAPCSAHFCSKKISAEIRAAMAKKMEELKQGGGEIYVTKSKRG